MRLIIAGSRSFGDTPILREEVGAFIDRFLIPGDSVEIVCGMASGADELGRLYAIEKDYDVRPFPANWDLYGKSAGIKRNTEMAKYADHAIVFLGRCIAWKHPHD